MENEACQLILLEQVDVLPGDEQQLGVDCEAGLQRGERGQDVGQICGSSSLLGCHQHLSANIQKVKL